MNNPLAMIRRRDILQRCRFLTFLLSFLFGEMLNGASAFLVPYAGRVSRSGVLVPFNNLISHYHNNAVIVLSVRSDDDDNNVPQLRTFREAEVLGLKFMQERKFEEALDAFQRGMTLPGSKSDIVRTKILPTSPVGGGAGGFESKNTLTLDEFELQAANYNMACAYAQLGNIDESINALKKALENGFDNYSTVRSDPDLDPIKGTKEFERLMESFEPSKGFNPFGFFGGKN